MRKYGQGAEQMYVSMKLAGVAVLLGAVAVAGWTLRREAAAPTPDDAAQQGAPIVEVTLPDSLSETAQLGKRAFEARCAACHGANAAGQAGVAPPLVHRIYEPGHHGDAAFQQAARAGVRAHHWPFGDMPPVEGLSAAQVTYITRYVRELQRANGIF